MANRPNVGRPETIVDDRHRHSAVAPVSFLIVTGVFELSAFLSVGTIEVGDLLWSLVALLVAVITTTFAERTHLRPLATLTPLAGFVWATLLIIATGGSTSGLGLAIVLPVTWSALNLEPVQSLIVVAELMVAEFISTSYPVALSDAFRIRRIGSYLLIGSLIAVAIHTLRLRLARIDAQRTLANDHMRRTIEVLEERNREERRLRRLMDQLHTCESWEAGYQLIGSAGPEILRSAGTIQVFNTDDNTGSIAASWSVTPGAQSFAVPADCAVFHEARTHQWWGSDHCGQMCAGTGATTCQPLFKERVAIGVLVVQVPEASGSLDSSWPPGDEFRRLVMTFAEQISTWITTFELRESLRELSVQDPLTRLFNRRYFEATLDRELDASRRDGRPVSLVMLDIDHFKEFNDSYGHATGDLVLQQVAELLQDLFRDSDVPARTGGEEFTIVLPNCAEDVALARAEQLRARLMNCVIAVDGVGVIDPPTVSIGISTSPPFAAVREMLLHGADRALYRSKRAGRDQTTVGRVSP